MINFIGLWSGYTEGAGTGRAYVRINGTAQDLKATVLVLRSEGFGETYKLRGRENTPTEAVFEIINCAVDYHNVTMPRTMRVNIIAELETSTLSGKWATNIGTLGNVHLYRATGFAKLVALIPFWLHATYRFIKKFIRQYFRYAYLILTVVLAMLSVFGRTTGKVGTIEAVMLLMPLPFLFRDQIYHLVLALRLRKAGPFEFFEQQARPPAGTVHTGYTRLQNEFGDDFPSLEAVARFFVPRTTYLLQVIEHFGRSLSHSDFHGLARSIGIPEHNIEATRQALTGTNCLAINNDGTFSVTDTGRLQLRFNKRVTELLTGPV